MARVICSFVFLLASVNSVIAEDKFEWSGLYLGGAVVVGKVSMDSHSTSVSTGYVGNGSGGSNLATLLGEMMGNGWSESSNSASLDVYAGYLWQQDRLVYGFELGYIPKFRLTSYEAHTEYYSSDDWKYYRDSRFSVDNLMSLRGRLGYVKDDWAFFMSGGLARGTINELTKTKTSYIGNHSMQFPVLESNMSDEKNGFTIGIGSEYRLTENFRLRAEFTYLNLGKVDYSFRAKADYGASSGGTAGSTFVYGDESGRHSLKASTLRVGLTYAF